MSGDNARNCSFAAGEKVKAAVLCLTHPNEICGVLVECRLSTGAAFVGAWNPREPLHGWEAGERRRPRGGFGL